MKTVVINRKRWLRGNGTGSLRNSANKQCCLGFVCRDFGIRAKDIFGRCMPLDIEWSLRSELPEWMLQVGSDSDVGKAAGVNDYRLGSNDIDSLAGVKTEKDRERLIKEIFARNGLRAKFVG